VKGSLLALHWNLNNKRKILKNTTVITTSVHGRPRHRNTPEKTDCVIELYQYEPWDIYNSGMC
jgi:hypothetical protein